MGSFKKLWTWVRDNLTWDALSALLTSKKALAIMSAVISALVSWWHEYGPLIFWFSILLGVALALFISNEISSKRMLRRSTPHLFGVGGIELYPNRQTLSSAWTFLNEFALPEKGGKSLRIWGAWFSGGSAFANDVLDNCFLEKVLFIDSGMGDITRLVSLVSGREGNALDDEITARIKMIQRHNQAMHRGGMSRQITEIKLHTGPLNISITFGFRADPNEDVLHADLLLASMPSREKISLRLKRGDSLAVFAEFQKQYEEIFAKGRRADLLLGD